MTVPGYPTSEKRGVDGDPCPSAEILERFIRLDLESGQRQAIRRHVEHCASCLTALDRASDSSIESALIRPTQLHEHDSTIKRLVDRLCQSLQLGHTAKSRHHAPIRFEPSGDGESLGRLNQFLIRRELASGGTGTVFEALDTLTDRSVAIKFIRSGDPQTLRRVEREARATSQVQHPAVVPVHSVETAADGRLFLVMPLVAGRSLAELLQVPGGLPLARAIDIVHEVALGIAAVHQQGLLHRDVKPANIVVDHEGHARLTDFGLASFVDEDSSLTQTGVVVGTPAYMSPEMARNDSQLDARSDIYSLGATLYECLTGTRPFGGQPHNILRQILEREPVRPSQINDKVPRPLEAICVKAMSKSPAGRYATATLLADDLLRWKEGRRVKARLPGLWRRGWNWVRKDPRFSLSLAAVVATLAAGIAVSGFYWSRAANQTRLAESRFDASLRTINTLADLATQSLSGDPGLAPIRRQIQTMADKAFEPLVGQRPASTPGLIRYLKAMDNLALIKHSTVGPSDAIAFRQRLIEENGPDVKRAAEDHELRRQWVGMLHRLAVGHIEMRAFPQATAALDEAEALLGRDDPAGDLLLARIRHSRGTIHNWVNGDYANAAPEFRRAVELAEQYAKTFPDDLLAPAQAANSKGWLSECEMNLGDFARAEELLREVHAHHARLASAPSGTHANQLEESRTALSLLNLFVARGDFDGALAWAREVGPGIERLHAANPTLMEPTAVKLGFGCHLASAELLKGQLTTAVERMNGLLPEAQALWQRFPDATRTWQVHGHARQLWFIARLNVADYEPLVPFLKEWIVEIREEIRQEKNTGFNQQMLMLLQCNLALALDWSGDAAAAKPVWSEAQEAAPETMRPAVGLLGQISASRDALRDGQILKLELHASLVPSLEVLAGFICGGPRYPAVHHMLAECHALALKTLQQESAPDADIVPRIKTHRESALQSLRTAEAAGFYDQGSRREKYRADPLFDADEFQQALK